MKIYPTREFLLECFDYNKETGELFWKKRPYSHFDDKKMWRKFNAQFSGKKITGRIVSISPNRYSVSKVIFKIVNGFEPPKHVHQKGFVNKTGIYFEGFIQIDKKKFSKKCKTEIEAQAWLRDTRCDFEKNRFPFVKTMRRSKHGLFNVSFVNGWYQSRIGYNGVSCSLGCFKTAKEASEAYQLAKQQIDDGIFIPPPKKISNTGFKGVTISRSRFKAQYKRKHLGTFDTPEQAHAAYLKAKNHKTFDDGLDILRQLASQYN